MFELSDTRQCLRTQARKLAEGVFSGRAAEIDRTEEYPWDNVTALREAGLLGMTIPVAYGGQGCDYLDAALVVEEIAKVCAVTARITVEANMGGVAAIMAYGTEAQKKLAASLVLGGDKPAIKHWITGGGVSKLHLIFARIIDGGEDRGIGAFLAVRGDIPESAGGLIIGRREPTMGLRGIPETEIILEDLFVTDAMALIPLDGRAGDPARGFAKLMTAYNSQRVGAASVALGIAEGAYEAALAYVQQREQFGRPIAEFQGLQWMLADMSIGLAAAQALVWKAAASAPEGGFPDMRQAAQSKILAAETAVKVTNDALQLHGAAGYSRDLPLERMVRDARMFTIGGGTAQVLRTQVAGALLGRKLPQTREGYLPKAPAAGGPRQVA
jgi:alkylation response protein AidB-like acyl-CoA dehydrogenase